MADGGWRTVMERNNRLLLNFDRDLSFFCSLAHFPLAPALALVPPSTLFRSRSAVRIVFFSLFVRTVRRPPSAVHQLQNRVRCTSTRVSSQRFVNRGESVHQLVSVRTLKLLEHGGTEHLRAYVVVEEFRDHLAASEEIRLSEEWRLEQFQQLEQGSCQSI